MATVCEHSQLVLLASYRSKNLLKD